MVETCVENLEAYHPPLLDRDGEAHILIAFLTFKRTHVKTRLSRFNAGKPHWLAANGARENTDIGDTK
jgi:hypothetical protein